MAPLLDMKEMRCSSVVNNDLSPHSDEQPHTKSKPVQYLLLLLMFMCHIGEFRAVSCNDAKTTSFIEEVVFVMNHLMPKNK